jgi:purine-binding chemotaxis protein CheW
VLNLPAGQFERNPPTLAAEWARCSAGVYRLQDQLLVVFDVDQLLAVGAEA